MDDKTVKQWFGDSFIRFEKSLNGESTSPLHLVRKKGFEKFRMLEFPTHRNEEWKYTSVKPLLNYRFDPNSGIVDISKEDIEKYLYDESIYSTLVFVNGKYYEKLSDLSKLEGKLEIMPLVKAIKSGKDEAINFALEVLDKDADIFSSLNTAFMMDGTYIKVNDDAVVDSPIQIIYVTSADKETVTNPRNVFIVGKHASVKLIETYAGLNETPYFTNTFTIVKVDEYGSIEHTKVQDETRNSFHISTLEVNQKRGSHYAGYNVNFGGSLVRNNLNIHLNGKETETTLNGLALSKGTQHIDNHTLINHLEPHCNSHQLYKSILDDSSRIVFNGKIFVKQDAQKTNAFQENKNIILSDSALVNAKPQLEIFADDVKCTHGATVGQLDKDALFYLKSRGFSHKEALATLIYAFASDAVHSIQLPLVRDKLEVILSEKLLTPALS
ncbi:MAG: Fe-S cluster assembly protein SufD [Ignavibacteriaceae bacterium]|jgi:Fe-S cluster assembly protein SufD|nr:Fe-S cluster assembly protein SufD [Ignavibacteriaceae bacterium]HPO56625.1 Fe-S cluster assembly protein SufD [Ignavibacteriaceae bacterium]